MLLSLASCVTYGKLLTSLSFGVIICHIACLHYGVVMFQIKYRKHQNYTWNRESVQGTMNN